MSSVPIIKKHRLFFIAKSFDPTTHQEFIALKNLSHCKPIATDVL